MNDGTDPSTAEPLGSIERLNQELAAALARNAMLQEQLDGVRVVRDGYFAELSAVRRVLQGAGYMPDEPNGDAQAVQRMAARLSSIEAGLRQLLRT